MISITDQKNLFIEIGNKLSRKITAYVIGGTAMMFLDFKEATKDIDIVFTNKDDRKIFKEIAKSLGYREMDSITVYVIKNNRPEMISLGESRLDLFLSDVIDFIFSFNMQKRAEQTHEFGKNLILKVADKHDIILMKCATRRPKDEEDIINIIKSGNINWNIIIEEAKEQVSLGKEHAIFDMIKLVIELNKKYKLDIPDNVRKDLSVLLEKQVGSKK